MTPKEHFEINWPLVTEIFSKLEDMCLLKKNWPASEKIEKIFHCTVQSIKYLMKVDDDSYINLRRLSEYVTIIDKRCSQKCIVGHVLGPNSPVIRPKFVQGFITQPKLIWYQLFYFFYYYHLSKGQTMSECIYEIIYFPKYHQKNLIVLEDFID